jgi:hypothetical protein
MTVPTEQEQNPVTLEPVAEPVAETVATDLAATPELVSTPELAATPAPPEPEIRVAPEAPLVAPSRPPAPAAADSVASESVASDSAAQLLGLPLQLLNQLLAKLGAAPLSSLAELMPALRLISLLVVAGVTLKLTGATLGAINELPLVGRLLELVGLISALQYLAANALRSQKRAELLARIQKLKRDFLG